MLRRLALGLALMMGAGLSTAHAQLFSEPFQFNRGGDGGAGMSLGHRQAIIDDFLNDNRPENLLRGPDGSLLDVADGPGGLAVVTTRQATIIPGASSRGVRGLGFAARHGSDSPGFVMLPDPSHALTAWTAMASGVPVPPQRWILRGHQPAPIDAWVAQVTALPHPAAGN